MTCNITEDKKETYVHIWYNIYFEPCKFSTVKAHVCFLNGKLDRYDFNDDNGEEVNLTPNERLIATAALLEKVTEYLKCNSLPNS